jgi:hypothetical protein
MLPLFDGVVLPFHGLLDAAFASLNVSVLLRLAFGIVPSPAAWTGLALFGSLGTLALMCFGVVAWRTLHSAARREYAEMARSFEKQQQLVLTRGRQSSSNSSPST